MSTIITRLETKYGIKVVLDTIYNPLSGRTLKRYKIYTADGCPWDKGLSYQRLLKECTIYGETFLKIKKTCEAKNEKFKTTSTGC